MAFRSLIVGTAGHIDHGKTSLIKALTGIDADRLEEEKRRGITIDLGFAHLQLENARIGFVDVPGHERFIRNMLAGAGGMDAVLLIIAADEGIMPQTVEHFEICRLLGIQHGITVLTKNDTVDAEALHAVREEAADLLRGSFLDAIHSPIIAVSAHSGEGMEALKSALSALAERVDARAADSIVRLPIDRIFTMKGHGSVVTGTLISGTINKDDELEIFPSAKIVRSRNVQVYGEQTQQARAGERTAVNLAGVSKEEMARGMMLATPGMLQSSSRIDVRIELLASAKRLRDGAPVHLHAFTSELAAQVRLMTGEKEIAPGKSGFAQLRLQEAVLLLPGDRFIIRQFSPVVTIGGGVVINAHPLPRKLSQDVSSALQALLAAPPEECLRLRISRRGSRGLALTEAIAETGLTRPQLEALLASTELSAHIFRAQDEFITKPEFETLQQLLLDQLDRFHQREPLAPAASKEELRKRMRLSPAIFHLAVEALLSGNRIETGGDTIKLAGRGVVLKDEEAIAKEIIENAFRSAGLKVPALKEVLAALPVDKARAQKIVTLLMRDRVLIKLADELVFHRDALEGLRQQVRAQKAKSPRMDVATFKDMTGISRKYAIPLLEFLDRERITRREGDARVIL